MVIGSLLEYLDNRLVLTPSRGLLGARLALVLLFSMSIVSCASQQETPSTVEKPHSTTQDSRSKENSIPPSSKWITSIHARVDGQVPDGALIFLGDSNTHSFLVSNVSSNAVNYGIGGDTTSGLLGRVKDYKSITRACGVVVAIGTNDVKYHRKPNETLKDYDAILNSIPAKVPVLVLAVFPQFSSTGKNKAIESLNVELGELALNHSNVHFLNVNSRLIDETGGLADAYAADGVHLNPKGYRILATELRRFTINNFPACQQHRISS